jgi:histidine triad (HIT) family protein
MAPCVFCEITAGTRAASIVAREEHAFAFLDATPLFIGHTLVVPIAHHETLIDLSPEMLLAVMTLAQSIARAIPAALGAQGTFVAMNNKVSQSVPHLHVHVVPRTKGDGLKGFFWPRTRYRDDAHRDETAKQITSALSA